MLVFLQNCIFNFCVILGATYLFQKLLCIKSNNNLKAIILCFIFSGLLSGATVFSSFAFGGSAFILAFLFILILQFIYKINFYISVCSGTIAYGISYLSMLLLRFPLETLLSFLPIENTYLINCICTACAGLLLFPILNIPFRIQRLKNGMPFLKENNGIIGVILSVSLLFIITYSNLQSSHLQFVILLVASAILISILFIWWRLKITNQYKQKLLQSEFDQLKEKFKKINEENQRLSAVIHKDNKLIQAILLTLHNSDSLDPNIDQLADFVNQLSIERQQLILPDFPTPASGNTAIDAVLSHMSQKAVKNDVNLTLKINSLPEIEILDLSTILADLIENSIHACHSTAQKELNLYLSDQIIVLKDSGIHFPDDVLLHLGEKTITSRHKNGGQGIGMFTIFNILRKYQASIQINCLDDEIFTKEIKISFDCKDQYTVPSINLSRNISIQ